MKLLIFLLSFTLIFSLSSSQALSNVDSRLFGMWSNSYMWFNFTSSGQFYATMGGTPLQGTYGTDSSKNPMWLDLYATSPLPITVQAIYMFASDSELHLALPDQASIISGTATRPTDFSNGFALMKQGGEKPPVLTEIDSKLVGYWTDGLQYMSFGENGHFESWVSGAALMGTYGTDASSDPKMVDIVLTSPLQGTVIPGIYKVKNGKLTIQIAAIELVIAGMASRPEEFSGNAMELWVAEPVDTDSLDNNLFGQWISKDSSFFQFLENGAFVGNIYDDYFQGTWSSNKNKDPSRINLTVYKPMRVDVPGIYETSKDQQGWKLLNIELPPLDEIENGDPSRPKDFSDNMMEMFEPGRPINQCPPTLECGECKDLCKKTCKTAKEYKSDCKDACKKKICSIFC